MAIQGCHACETNPAKLLMGQTHQLLIPAQLQVRQHINQSNTRTQNTLIQNHMHYC